MLRCPSISGTSHIAIASITGTETRNSIVEPCSAKASSYSLRRHAAHVRLRELQPHVDRQHAGEEQQRDGRHDVAGGDPLVVDGGEEAPQPGRVAARSSRSSRCGVGVGGACRRDRHRSDSR